MYVVIIRFELLLPSTVVLRGMSPITTNAVIMLCSCFTHVYYRSQLIARVRLQLYILSGTLSLCSHTTDGACAMQCVLVPEVNWLFVLPWVPTETESRVSCVHISWKVRFVYRCMSQCSCNIVRVVLLVAIEVEQPLSPSWPRSFCCSYPQSDK